jgi:tetratricopeptide (TPR) repeat protein
MAKEWTVKLANEKLKDLKPTTTREKLEKVVAEAEKLLTADTQNILPHRMGLAYAYLGDFTKARAYLPTLDGRLLSLFIQAAIINKNNSELGALSATTKRDFPRHSGALCLLARHYRDTHAFADSLEFFDLLIASDKTPLHRYERAEVLHALGRNDEAVSALYTVLHDQTAGKKRRLPVLQSLKTLADQGFGKEKFSALMTALNALDDTEINRILYDNPAASNEVANHDASAADWKGSIPSRSIFGSILALRAVDGNAAKVTGVRVGGTDWSWEEGRV